MFFSGPNSSMRLICRRQSPFFSSVIYMLMHGRANGTVSRCRASTLWCICSCRQSAKQPNRCLTAVILTANSSSSSHTNANCWLRPKVEVFIWAFCIISTICLQGNRIKRLEKICREYVNRLELYFLPASSLLSHRSFILNVIVWYSFV